MSAKKNIEWHQKIGGKIKVKSKINYFCNSSLKKLFGGGISPVLEVIKEEPDKIWNFSIKNNSIAFISNGSGLTGDHSVNPNLALPLLESKASFLTHLTGINGIPLTTQKASAAEFKKFMIDTQTSFGAFIISDIGAPECFQLDTTNVKDLHIPTINIGADCRPIAILAALINCCRLTNQKLKQLKVVLEGHYPILVQTIPLLASAGIKSMTVITDNKVITKPNLHLQPQILQDLIATHNLQLNGSALNKLDAAKSAQVYIALKGADHLDNNVIENMVEKPWIFALNHPEPSISYVGAKSSLAFIYCTNQIGKNNHISSLLVFPGVAKALLSREITVLNNELKIRAAYGIANSINKEKITPQKILSNPKSKKLVLSVYNEIMKDIEEKQVEG